MSDKKGSDFVGYFKCIADELPHKNPCNGNGLAIYRYNKEGQIFYEGFCWSCSQYFTKKEVQGSHLESELEKINSVIMDKHENKEVNRDVAEEEQKKEDPGIFKVLFVWAAIFGVGVLMVKAEETQKGSSGKIFIAIMFLLLLYYLFRKGISKFMNRLMGLVTFFIVLAVIVMVFGVFSELFSFSRSSHNPTDIYNRP